MDAISKAVVEGLELLERLVACPARAATEEDRYLLRVPHWLPRAKAVVFARSVKAGAVFGVQHGHAFVVARLPYGSAEGRLWSAPWFMKLGGVEWGVVLGARQVDTLIGVMSDRALEQLTTGAKLAFGAEAAEALPDGDSAPSVELFFTNLNDWSSISVSRGFMVDLAVEGMVLTADRHKNAEAYGQQVTAADVLQGALPPPAAAAPLAHRLREMEDCAVAAAFEPSHAASSEED